MIVVADTSPINYLVLIGHIEVLHALYNKILIPPAVLPELKHPLTPEQVRNWASDQPTWLAVYSPRKMVMVDQLDPGESEALALADEVSADVVLIDDLAGRHEAVRRGLKVAGTLSVLDEADLAGLVVFDDVIAKLRKTSFRLSDKVLAEIRRSRGVRG